MSETETVGPCLVQKLKWEGGGGGGMAPLAPPVATPLLTECILMYQIILVSSKCSQVPG